MFESLTKDTLYEYPSFKVALFSILLAFVLSSVIAVTYHLTNRGLAFSRNFFQAMVLSSIVSCMVIMAVGNNIAAGFGIIGAIAIIRFRMTVENPRNIIFIFGSLSVGVASGVYGYSIALSGTIVFCLIAILLFYSQYGGSALAREYSFQVTLSDEVEEDYLTDFLKEFCQYFRLISINSTKTGRRYRYFVMLKKDVDKQYFFQQGRHRNGMSNIRLDRDDNLDRI